VAGWSAKSIWFSRKSLEKDIAQTLSEGTYIMIACMLDKSTGELVNKAFDKTSNDNFVGHWVVVTAARDSGITIYNPFTNTYQQYSWNDFKKTYGVAILIRHDERFKKTRK
jgi:hypothetical protein